MSDFEGLAGGMLVGAAGGALVSLAAASGQVAADIKQRQRNLATVSNWSAALDKARQRATAAERQVQRQQLEIDQLRKSLAYAELELSMWRNA